MKKAILYILAVSFLAGSTFTSCSAIKNANNTQKGATIGTAAGGALGAIIARKNPALGAVLGGVIGGVAGGLIGNNMDKQARQIEQALPTAEVERVGEGIKLTLGENAIRFAVNKSSLTTTSKANLNKLIGVFQEYKETNIIIYGYTDSTGRAEYNKTLSEKRANSVKDFFIGKGLNPNRFQIKGLGIENPIASNDTAEGRSKNRRVEFAIVANQQMVNTAKNEADK